jgi:hypothetical protein
MNNRSELIPLKFEVAHEYVIQCLNDGKSLSKAVLEQIDFAEGSFFSLLNHLADKTKIYHFDRGSILPPSKLESVIFREDKYSARKKLDSSVELATYLENKIDSNLCCYFEDVVHEKNDPINHVYKNHVLYFGDDINLFLNGHDFSKEMTLKLIHYSDAQWHYMNIISKEDPGNSNELSEKKIMKIAEHSTQIIFGAYDMEGYVIWERFK